MLSQRSRLNHCKTWLSCLTLVLAFGLIGCNRSGNKAASSPAAGDSAVENNVAGDAADVAPAAPAKVLKAQRASVEVCKLGAKLRDNNDAQKIITGAPGVLLDVKVGAVLNIQIPQALQIFKASEGRVPKNHAEFLSQVVERNQLKLPELIDGLVYRFNPEKEELWVYPQGEAPPEK
jgi:hypothetical protein